MNVRKLRVTAIASSVVRDDFDATYFGSSEKRREEWAAPGSHAVLGLPWSYPWLDSTGQPVEPDRTIWGDWAADRRIGFSTGDAIVKVLLRQAIPLRVAVPVSIAVPGVRSASAFAETFLQPWTAVGAVTATLDFEPPFDLTAAAARFDAFRHEPTVTALLTSGSFSGTIVQAAERLAADAVEAVNLSGLDVRRGPEVAFVTTVIDADLDDPNHNPTKSAEFRADMQRLSGTTAAGVPLRWLRGQTAAGIGCSTSEVRAPLRSGISQWCQGALASTPADPVQQTNGVHRNAVVHWVMLASLHGLLGNSWTSPPAGWFETLRADYANLLGRHYGPAATMQDWNSQAYVEVRAISSVLPNPVVQSPWACP